MYYNLIVPLQEREKAAFRVTLQKFLSFATDRKPKFATYFNTTYCSRALCSLLQTPNSCKHKHVPGDISQVIKGYLLTSQAKQKVRSPFSNI